jgi:hypothetical protein
MINYLRVTNSIRRVKIWKIDRTKKQQVTSLRLDGSSNGFLMRETS